MSYRERLPQLDGDLFLADGGLETTLVFHRGIDLPVFAAFPLLDDERGAKELKAYYEPYVALARERGLGIVLESPTWRASPRWGQEVGYSAEQLDHVNRRAIALLEELRAAAGEDAPPIVISGCVGPHDDAYNPSELLGAEDAQGYHSTQINTFADTAADLVTAMTITYAEEAIGIVRAARDADMPVVLSFTVETDGRLPSGQPLGAAIEETDAATDSYAAYFMINCAHATHFDGVLEPSAGWAARIRGVRANASTMSHAELDEATELDDGDPDDLGARYAALRERLPHLNVLGGCCGTDQRHVGAICDAVTAA